MKLLIIIAADELDDALYVEKIAKMALRKLQKNIRDGPKRHGDQSKAKKIKNASRKLIYQYF
jgi:hypothetical protein